MTRIKRLEHCLNGLYVSHNLISCEVSCTERADVSIVTCNLNLSLDLAWRPVVVLHFIKSCSGQDELVFRVLTAPPSKQAGKTLSGWINCPVKLRGHVVKPAFVEPELRVGVDTVILIKSGDSCRITGS